MGAASIRKRCEMRNDIILGPTVLSGMTKSPHEQDNRMYWGIILHDKHGYKFRHTGMTMQEMGELLRRVTPNIK